MDVRELILNQLKRKGSLKVSDIVELTGFSRVYIHRFFKQLVDEGRILLAGKANQSHYVMQEDGASDLVKLGFLRTHRILRNRNLSEDFVLAEIKTGTAVFVGLPDNVTAILDYAFTEMLNNAIEHSRSELIDVAMIRGAEEIRFQVSDTGIGIFNNLMITRNLATDLEAIQDLLKGKQTTSPEAHSGEGIFFTSRVANILSIRSSTRKLVFDNVREDVFIRNIRSVRGTKVSFSIRMDSIKELDAVFARHTDDSFKFDRTTVKVKLFKEGAPYVSRSQARRIVTGLDKFSAIELDFEGIQTVGQGFADEIFRVWRLQHPGIRIVARNAGETVLFMIRHAAPDYSLLTT